jgi:hypothetical protein
VAVDQERGVHSFCNTQHGMEMFAELNEINTLLGLRNMGSAGENLKK